MRLDLYLLNNGYFDSRNKAQYEIKKGNVFVNGSPILKSSHEVSDSDIIELNHDNGLKYVSKGGLKLEKALSYYKINPNNLVCLDIGSSTGGFTDCLIKNGASLVYAVDTGSNQLHESLKNNKKVISKENTNYLDLDSSKLNKIDLVVIDVSFVRIETILEKVINDFKEVKVIALIKPQFELGKVYIKNGVVKDPKLHKMVIENIKTFLELKNVEYKDIIESPILGGSGNKEFLISFDL